MHDDNNFGDHYRDNPSVGVLGRIAFSKPSRREVSNSYIDDMMSLKEAASRSDTDTDIELPGSIGPMDNQTYDNHIEADLHPEGYKKLKPSPKDLIKARIAKIQKGYEDETIQKRQDEDDLAFKVNQSADTSIAVDRAGLEPRTTFLKKSAENSLIVMEDENINPIKIMIALEEKWKDEWFDWEPETIIQTFHAEGISIGNINLSKMFAIRSILKTDEFFNNPRSFEKVVIAFSGRIVDWGYVQEVSVSEMNSVVALIERYIREDDFSDDVSGYIAARAVNEGFVKLPSSLYFATGNLNYLIAINMGDSVALDLIDQLNESLENEDGNTSPEVAVQYLRLAKCEYKSQELIEQARK
jgi:hypothetical protein